MGIPVLILGESGSGKTFSIRNLDPKTTGVFMVEKQRLPFKNDFKIIKNATYKLINQALNQPTMQTYIIDDSQYLMVNEFFDKANLKGYDKFTDIALNFRNLIHMVNHDLADNIIVYFLHHTEFDNNYGKTKAKTIGKMLDNMLTIEGCFDIVLKTEMVENEYKFVTQNNGQTTCKSPYQMFETEYIDNDLNIVNEKIKEYYNL